MIERKYFKMNDLQAIVNRYAKKYPDFGQLRLQKAISADGHKISRSTIWKYKDGWKK